MNKPASASKKLQAVIAQAGLTSRRQAETLIAAGKVTVNGERAKIGQRVLPQDEIKVSGKPLRTQIHHRYFLINKPKGYVSTTADEQNRKTVVDLLPKMSERIYPVGRLDKDSEGLMLLTNDGDLAYRLTHPKFEIPKTYKVLVDHLPSPKAISFLKRGVKLNEGMTSAAEVEIVNEVAEGAWLELTIHEGRYHHVRRMLRRAGYETIRLIRLKLGPFSIRDLHGKPIKELDYQTTTRRFNEHDYADEAESSD